MRFKLQCRSLVDCPWEPGSPARDRGRGMRTGARGLGMGAGGGHRGLWGDALSVSFHRKGTFIRNA